MVGPDQREATEDPRATLMNEWFERFHSTAGEEISKFFGSGNNWTVSLESDKDHRPFPVVVSVWFAKYFGRYNRFLTVEAEKKNRQKMYLAFMGNDASGKTIVGYRSGNEEINLGPGFEFNVQLSLDPNRSLPDQKEVTSESDIKELVIISGNRQLTLWGGKVGRVLMVTSEPYDGSCP